MALPKPLALFIPRKTQKPVQQPDYGVDMRAIEAWAKVVVAYVDALASGAAYASLTGPGQTTTPGDLTQAGGLTVNAPNTSSSGIQLNDAGTGIGITETGAASIQITNNNHLGVIVSCPVSNGNVGLAVGTGLTTIAMQGTAGGGIQIVTDSAQTGGINITANGNNGIVIEAAGTGTIELVTVFGHIKIGGSPSGDHVGFFGSSGDTQQTVLGSRGGNAALASLLTELANYGLIVDGSTP